MPFSELQSDAYGPGGPMSGRDMKRDEALYDAKSDVVTHRASWRNALEMARDSCNPVIQATDRAYWEHELRAFDRTFDVLQREFK